MHRRRSWFVPTCAMVLLSVRLAGAAEPSGKSAVVVAAEPPGKSAAVVAAEPPGKSAAVVAAEPSGKSAAVVAAEPSGKSAAVVAAEPSGKSAAVVSPEPTSWRGSATGARPAAASTFLAPPAGPAAAPSPPSLRLPAFIALGVGGLSAGGAVVTGMRGSGNHEDPKLDCGTRCGRQPSSDEGRAMATKILAGVAAVGVSTGLVLLLLAPRKEKPSFTPSLGLSIGASKATAKALWRF